MPIRPLDNLLINQIAAGEVIERPASIVKELLENAIDAGARRITIELEQGGIERITIADDGGGIPSEELPLAVAPHATSKITRAEDLDAIGTLGFRGEALASIASVARLGIRSRTPDSASANRIEAAGAEVQPVRPAAGPVGTTVTARNLFFNTPARRKFLRTTATEFGHCHQVVRTIAMSHPGIGFLLKHDGREILDLPAEDEPRRRLVELLGKELADQLIDVSLDAPAGGGLALWGVVGTPAIARNNTKLQHVFLNGRAVRDRSIQHALKEAYRGLIEPGKQPTAVLFLEMDPTLVDVNVHPAKAEVRFRDQALVHGAVHRTVRDALAGADLTPASFGGWGGNAAPPEGELRAFQFGPGNTAANASDDAAAFRDETAAPPTSGSGAAATRGAGGLHDFVDHFRRLDPKQKGFVYREVAAAMQHEEAPDHNAAAAAEDDTLPTPKRLERIMQVHDSFIVTQDEQGLVIIDQHALHERIMFETLQERIGKGNLESQRLLVPETVDATPAQATLLDELKPLLERIGVEAEQMGPRSIAVHAFPSFLFERKVEVQPFLRELLDRAEEDDFAPSDEAALHEVLDMMACKAAVKAGDRLKPEEVEELLRKRERYGRASNCPHGRPTTIRITLADLEKQFGRR
jgi:DNA mismatch repair protein MutL